MDDGDGEDAAGGGDQRDFAEGCGKGREELLCVLCRGISWCAMEEEKVAVILFASLFRARLWSQGSKTIFARK